MNKLDEYLKNAGLKNIQKVIHNPTYEQLRNIEISEKKGSLAYGEITRFGARSVQTGSFTGRTPMDKYIVDDENTHDNVWWENNQKISKEIFDSCLQLTKNQLSHKNLYVVDAFCGANVDSRIKVRIITEVAWQAHFVTNMFIRPDAEELDHFDNPDFLIMNASMATNPNWKKQGLNSKNFVMFDFTRRMQIIGGTWYGGEMKKGIFSFMNYYNPLRKIQSMHCAANVSGDGEVALFFGLSGTGKTTLSTDSKRYLIGDDEHGWDEKGVFNYEGGCYAKTNGLSKKKEPNIWNAITSEALLENIIVKNGEPDFFDASITENTRVSYPIYNINKIVLPSRGTHPKIIIYLTADATGVLPPVSLLNEEQALYYYINGYTAKMAGTEAGVTEAIPNFSACFGQAFLTLHPLVYASLLKDKIKKHDVQVYLVNTGWSGRRERISLKNTRKIIDSIMDGSINTKKMEKLRYFNLLYPTSLDGVSIELNPENGFEKKSDWQIAAQKLARQFINNFDQFMVNTASSNIKKLVDAGPTINTADSIVRPN